MASCSRIGLAGPPPWSRRNRSMHLLEALGDRQVPRFDGLSCRWPWPTPGRRPGGRRAWRRRSRRTASGRSCPRRGSGGAEEPLELRHTHHGHASRLLTGNGRRGSAPARAAIGCYPVEIRTAPSAERLRTPGQKGHPLFPWQSSMKCPGLLRTAVRPSAGSRARQRLDELLTGRHDHLGEAGVYGGTPPRLDGEAGRRGAQRTPSRRRAGGSPSCQLLQSISRGVGPLGGGNASSRASRASVGR